MRQPAIQSSISCLGLYDRHNANGATLLHCAAELGEVGAVSAVLRIPKLERHYTVDADAPSANGSTPLVAASANGHLGAVRRLLATGRVDVRKRSRDDGCTAAIVAARHGHSHVLRALVAAGADLSQPARGGVSAVCVAVSELERWRRRRLVAETEVKAMRQTALRLKKKEVNRVAEKGGEGGDKRIVESEEESHDEGGNDKKPEINAQEVAALVRARRAAKAEVQRWKGVAETVVWLGGVVEASRQVAHRLFRQIDDDNSARLSAREIGRLLHKLRGERPTAADIQAVMASADNSGEVDFEEFYGWWCATLPL